MKLEQHDKHIALADWLQQRDQAVAITLTGTLEPAGGPGSVIFPPTYARKGGDHPYAISELRKDLSPEAAAAQGLEANFCDLDSVGSQANRMEPAFAEPPLNALVPQLLVQAGASGVNLLRIGHRIADAAVRFSGLGDRGSRAIAALRTTGDAGPLGRLAPTSLVFGFWDSRGSMTRWPRIVSSTIRATNVAVLKRSAQFNPVFDPVALDLDGAGDSVAAVEADEKHPLARLGLRFNPAVDRHGGVRVFGKIIRRTQINLVVLRSVVVINAGRVAAEETLRLRRYLLGLALVAGRVQSAFDLRQGCLLVPAAGHPAEACVVPPSGQRLPFTWEFGPAFNFAQAAAQDFGIWNEAAAPKTFRFQTDRAKSAIQDLAKTEPVGNGGPSRRRSKVSTPATR